MKRFSVPALLLTLTVSGVVIAEEEDMTLQQERDQIGADMESNRRQIGRDINAIREPGVAPDSAIGTDAAGASRPNNNVGNRATQPQQAPIGGAGPSGVTPPSDSNRPITTTGSGRSTVEPGSPTTTGTPAAPIRNSDANGNVRPNGGPVSGGMGTTGGNGTGTGTAAPSGSAAGAGND